MNQTFKHKWIKIINQSNEQKCRLFIKRLKQQPIDVPFNSKQKFVWKLLRTRLEYLAQEKNLNNIKFMADHLFLCSHLRKTLI